MAAANNPELAALAHDLQGRADALERARMEYFPDFNPFAGFTGTVSQVIGLGVSIPTFLPRVKGMVEEARADLGRMRAMCRQEKFDQASQVVAALYTLRNAERQADLFEQLIAPAAQRVADNARQAYAAGTGSFIDLIDAQRTLLDVRLTAAEARTARGKNLADLEALIGREVETVNPPPAATQPAAGGDAP